MLGHPERSAALGAQSKDPVDGPERRRHRANSEVRFARLSASAPLKMTDLRRSFFLPSLTER